jgi:hypothetical protein
LCTANHGRSIARMNARMAKLRVGRCMSRSSPGTVDVGALPR